MKRFTVTITSAQGLRQMTGIFRSQWDAVLAGMDQLEESQMAGRVSAKLEPSA
jgi:hypothetical protein